MARKLIIDGDPGIGDALAVLTAIADPSIELIAVTGTAGAVSGIQATRNLQYLIEMVDPLRHPRIGQSDVQLSLGQDAPDCMSTRHALNGSSGLGELDVQIPDLHNRRESGRLIVDVVREFPHEVTLLTLGPLTNVLIACDLEPELPDLISGIVSLGGSVSSGGDITAAAEFNIWADAEAARSVFRLPMHHTLVPLEVSSQPILTFEDIDLLASFIDGSLTGQIIASMLHFSSRAYRQFMAFEGIPLHSIVALAVAARAESFCVNQMAVEVETAGEITRGMTVVDRRRMARKPANTDVVTEIDVSGVIDYFSRSIRRVSG